MPQLMEAGGDWDFGVEVLMCLCDRETTLLTIFDCCTPKKDLAKPQSKYLLDIWNQNYNTLIYDILQRSTVLNKDI
jgi:hypothetical protein